MLGEVEFIDLEDGDQLAPTEGDWMTVILFVHFYFLLLLIFYSLWVLLLECNGISICTFASLITHIIIIEWSHVCPLFGAGIQGSFWGHKC